MTDLRNIGLGNASAAYFRAVTYAAFAFVVLVMGRALYAGFESASSNDLLTKSVHFVAITLLFFAAGWPCIAVAAAIPYAVGIAVANKFKIFNGLYFTAGGALSGLALSPLFISVPNLGNNEHAPAATFYEKFEGTAPFFMAVGAIAGIACWRSLRRGLAGRYGG